MAGGAGLNKMSSSWDGWITFIKAITGSAIAWPHAGIEQKREQHGELGVEAAVSRQAAHPILKKYQEKSNGAPGQLASDIAEGEIGSSHDLCLTALPLTSNGKLRVEADAFLALTQEICALRARADRRQPAA